MTIKDTTRRAGPYQCNGLTTRFSFDFKVTDPAYVRVVRSVGNIEVALGRNTDYSCVLNQDQDNSPGGQITLKQALPEGVRIAILSDEPYTQDAVFTNKGGFYPETLNECYDKLTILVQQVRERTDRAVIVPASSSETPEQMYENLLDARDEAVEYGNIATEQASIATEAREKSQELHDAVVAEHALAIEHIDNLTNKSSQRLATETNALSDRMARETEAHSATLAQETQDHSDRLAQETAGYVTQARQWVANIDNAGLAQQTAVNALGVKKEADINQLADSRESQINTLADNRVGQIASVYENSLVEIKAEGKRQVALVNIAGDEAERRAKTGVELVTKSVDDTLRDIDDAGEGQINIIQTLADGLNEAVDEAESKVIMEGYRQINYMSAEARAQINRLTAIVDTNLPLFGNGGTEYGWTVTQNYSAGVAIRIPNDARYIVGRHHLRISWNRQILTFGIDFLEVGELDATSSSFRLLFDIAAGDKLAIYIVPLCSHISCGDDVGGGGSGGNTGGGGGAIAPDASTAERVATLELAVVDLVDSVVFHNTNNDIATQLSTPAITAVKIAASIHSVETLAATETTEVVTLTQRIENLEQALQDISSIAVYHQL